MVEEVVVGGGVDGANLGGVGIGVEACEVAATDSTLSGDVRAGSRPASEGVLSSFAGGDFK